LPNFIEFPSIEQFRHIIKQVELHTIDEERVRLGLGEEVDISVVGKLPTLKFTGTVKLHGTNAAVGYCDEIGEVWAQSRTTLLSAVARDQFGFYTWVQEKKDVLRELAKSVIHEKDETVYIFGEWCGSSIQKNVALQKLPKMFCIFAVLVAKNNVERWLRSSVENDLDSVNWLKSLPEHRIYNIYDFPMYSIEIDFNKPELSQPMLEELTLAVEKQCPVSMALGSSGVGEGIVWSTYLHGEHSNLRFKTKGSEHSVVKTKETVAVDVAKMASVQSFIDYVVTENRLKQGIERVFATSDAPSLKRISDFIKWIEIDILKEESDTMHKNNLEVKDVSKQIGIVARAWFINYCKLLLTVHV
jgi:hypothetical protein